MADILVVVEHQEGVFKKNTLSVVSAAKALAGLTGGEVYALVLGDSVASVGVDTTPKVRVLSYVAPKQRAGGGRVADVAELVSKLKNEAKVL